MASHDAVYGWAASSWMMGAVVRHSHSATHCYFNPEIAIWSGVRCQLKGAAASLTNLETIESLTIFYYCIIFSKPSILSFSDFSHQGFEPKLLKALGEEDDFDPVSNHVSGVSYQVPRYVRDTKASGGCPNAHLSCPLIDEFPCEELDIPICPSELALSFKKWKVFNWTFFPDPSSSIFHCSHFLHLSIEWWWCILRAV